MPKHLPVLSTKVAKRPDALRDWNPIVEVPSLERVRELSGDCGQCAYQWCGTSVLSPHAGTGGCAIGTQWGPIHGLICQGDLRAAYALLRRTQPFGRLMPSCNAECEANCSLRQNHRYPVGIQSVEFGLAEWAWQQGLVKPRRLGPRHGKKVLVVGGGLAGMTAAHELIADGYGVTVVEADALFGLVVTAVPDFKHSKAAAADYAAILREEGVDFRVGQRVGTGTFSVDKIFREYDGAVIAIGAHLVSPLRGVSGADASWVISAHEFLAKQNLERRSAGVHRNPHDVQNLDTAIVVGAGWTADDTIRTLQRLRPKLRIVQVIRRPMPDINEPPPLWPVRPVYTRRLLTEHDGLSELHWDSVVAKIEGSVERGRVYLKTNDGSEGPMFEGRVKVFYALGFDGATRHGLFEQLRPFGLQLTEYGTIAVRRFFQTTIESFPVTAGGDCATGMEDYARAIATGREAAFGLAMLLRGETRIVSLAYPELCM